MLRGKNILMALVLVANLIAVNAYARPAVSCPIKSTTDFVYYSGSGASSLSQSWMVHFLDWWKVQDPTIEYVKLSAAEIAACDMTGYPDLDMYIEPGGDAYLAQRAIGASGKARINSFLDSGGSYFGACAGWYFAAADYVWQDNYYAHPNVLGKYPATVEGSIREIADYDLSSGYAVTQLDNGHTALYWGGPTIGYEYTSAVVGLVDARFAYRGLPAVVKYNNMLLTSVHLEAYENDGFTGLSTLDREANYRYLARLINQVAGTVFLVPVEPPPPVPKACDDGQDNDGDSKIDMNDPGCSSKTDDDERDTSLPPVDAFFDTFEGGFTWTLSGTGTPWGIRTDNVLDGSYSAGVKQTTAGNLSFMQHAINLSGYSTARFEYARKLVGLDVADDFSAEYFSSGAWKAVEVLGSGSENGGFVAKSFDIPISASAIRFMCEAGAVSEGCWVDNVRIVVQ